MKIDDIFITLYYNIRLYGGMEDTTDLKSVEHNVRASSNLVEATINNNNIKYNKLCVGQVKMLFLK